MGAMMQGGASDITEVNQQLALVAAELLAACKAIKAWIEGEGTNDDWHIIVKRLNDAINNTESIKWINEEQNV